MKMNEDIKKKKKTLIKVVFQRKKNVSIQFVKVIILTNIMYQGIVPTSTLVLDDKLRQ